MLGTARPDIAEQLRYRKRQELQQDLVQLTGKNITAQGKVKLLTSCPACQQGLSRYTDDTGLETDFIVVELCNHNPGENWQREFVASVYAGGIERVLLQPVGFQQRHKQATATQGVGCDTGVDSGNCAGAFPWLAGLLVIWHHPTATTTSQAAPDRSTTRPCTA